MPAMPLTEVILPWALVGLIPAAPEQPAIGPDRLAVSADGHVALYDPGSLKILVIQGEKLVSSFAVPRADGLVFAPDGDLVVLDSATRQLRRYSEAGSLEAQIALPALAPLDGTLMVWGEEAVLVDPFGNGHALSLLSGAGLDTRTGAVFRPSPWHLWRSADPCCTVRLDAASVRVEAIKAGARVFPAGESRWLVVDAVVADAPIQVERHFFQGTTELAEIDLSGRLYNPTQDVAAGANGQIVQLLPRADGLHLITLTPGGAP